MRKFLIILLSLVLVISLVNVIFPNVEFRFSSWFNFVVENFKSINLDSLVKVAKNFPDFKGGLFDIISDALNVLVYPVKLLVEVIKIIIDILSNVFIIFGGIIGGSLA